LIALSKDPGSLPEYRTFFTRFRDVAHRCPG
jgi:hypothetical protein